MLECVLAVVALPWELLLLLLDLLERDVWLLRVDTENATEPKENVSLELEVLDAPPPKI